MNRRNCFALIGFIAALLPASFANAQCPDAALSAIAGTWEFATEGFTVPALQFLGSAGRFVASAGVDQASKPLGILAVTQTSAINNSVTRQETGGGRYQLNNDCSGGTLTFNTASRALQFDFFLVNPGEMVMVGNSNGDVVSGRASLATPAACTATPLSTIAGTWVFSLKGFDLVRNFPELAAAGRFVIDGSSLAVTETAGSLGGNVRLQVETGRVAVDDDCAGGSMSFSTAGRVMQLDFFFVDGDRILLVGTTSGDIVTGEARHFIPGGLQILR